MLPSLTGAFLLGLVFGSQSVFFPVTVVLGLFALAAGLTWLERTGVVSSRRSAALYAALLSGVLYWAWTIPPSSPSEVPPSSRDIVPLELTGRVIAPVQHAPGRQTLLVDLDGQRPSDRPHRVRVVWRDAGTARLQGDRVRFRAKLHPPSGTQNPGGFDYAGYLERQGIEAVTTIAGAEAMELMESGAVSWRWTGWNQVDQWRAAIRNAAVQSLTQPVLGVFLGIVIGERGYLQLELQEWFMATGTIHLLSISGSHLGLVAVVVFGGVRQGILRLLPLPLLLTVSRSVTATRLAIVVTWPMVALYALLAGAELATVRSLAMITVGLLTVWIGHQRHLYHAMAAAALVIVWHDPRAIFDISFQLSFLSVLVIIRTVYGMGSVEEAETPQSGPVRRLVHYGRDALVMSAAVTMATLPAVAWYFNQVPWLGIVSNLAAIPYTGIVLVPLSLLTALWSVVTGTDHLPAGWLLERLFAWLLHGLRFCSELPGVEWHIRAPSVPSIVLFYLALGAATAGWASRRLRLFGVGLVVLVLCGWIWSPRWDVDGDRWRVTFLDVGQGDSAVIELPDGETVLIDGGARYERFDMGRGVVAPFLWNRGIRHLDHVIGTHEQLDHVGGLTWVLRHVPVGRYWTTGVERSEQFAVDLRTTLRERRIPHSVAARGTEVLPRGPCRLTTLNPDPAGEATLVLHTSSGTMLNNHSIVSRLTCGAHSVLFAADIESDGLRRLGDEGRRQVTVLKVPHHGARSSLDGAWIRAVHPQYAVISVGRGNSYGHPVAAVLKAYQDEQATVARTDRDGAVWISGRLSVPDTLVMMRMRDLTLQPIDVRACVWACEQDNWRRLWLQVRL